MLKLVEHAYTERLMKGETPTHVLMCTDMVNLLHKELEHRLASDKHVQDMNMFGEIMGMKIVVINAIPQLHRCPVAIRIEGPVGPENEQLKPGEKNADGK